jgi:hypothetical protein
MELPNTQRKVEVIGIEILFRIGSVVGVVVVGVVVGFDVVVVCVVVGVVVVVVVVVVVFVVGVFIVVNVVVVVVIVVVAIVFVVIVFVVVVVIFVVCVIVVVVVVTAATHRRASTVVVELHWMASLHVGVCPVRPRGCRGGASCQEGQVRRPSNIGQGLPHCDLVYPETGGYLVWLNK